MVIEASDNYEQHELLNAALQYASEGFRIVPCHTVRAGKCSCRKGSCRKAGKHPRIRNWTNLATCNASQIEEWWGKWPNSNVGVATGADSGLLVFDFDGEAGKLTLQQLADTDASVLKTRIHRTGSDGQHLLFQHPGGHCGNSTRILPGMDIRGDGGLIILPPSLHSSGNRYEVDNDQPIAALPASLSGVLTPCHKERQGCTKSDKRDEEVEGQTKQVMERKRANSETLPKVPRKQIEWALNNSLPRGPGRRNRQIFELARHLLAVDGITQDIPAIEFRRIVERWHDLAVKQAAALGFSIDGDVEETWTDFQHSLLRVKHPVGAELHEVFDHVFSRDWDGLVPERLVWNSLEYFRRMNNREMRLLIGVLFELSIRTGEGTCSLACQAGATQFNRLGFGQIDGKWILRRLRTLTMDGILECLDRGIAGPKGVGRAAQYRWIWTMRDPPAFDL